MNIYSCMYVLTNLNIYWIQLKLVYSHALLMYYHFGKFPLLRIFAISLATHTAIMHAIAIENTQIFIQDSFPKRLLKQGENPNSLHNIYSQDILKGRPGTSQQDVRGHSNRMSCNVLFLHFHLIFVPPMHVYEQYIYVRQLWLESMLVITL